MVLDFEHVDQGQIDGLHQVLAALSPRELLLLGSSARRPKARLLLEAGAQWAEDPELGVEILSTWLEPPARVELPPAQGHGLITRFQSDLGARAHARALVRQATDQLAAVLDCSPRSQSALGRLQRVLGAQALLEGGAWTAPNRRVAWKDLALERLEQLRWLGPEQGSLMVRPCEVPEILAHGSLLAAAFDSLVLAIWHSAGAKSTLWVHLERSHAAGPDADVIVRLCVATQPASKAMRAVVPADNWILELAQLQAEVSDLELWAAAAVLEMHAVRWRLGVLEHLPSLQLDFPAAPSAERSS